MKRKNRLEIIYYNNNKYRFSRKKTDTFLIVEVNASKTKMKYRAEYVNGVKLLNRKIHNDWINYRRCGYEQPLSEEDFFILSI